MTTPGAGITAADMNAAACEIVQGWAALAREATALAKYVEGLGIPGLESAGFSTTETATEYSVAVAYIKTVALLFTGQAVQPDQFDFSAALAKFVGVPRT